MKLTPSFCILVGLISGLMGCAVLDERSPQELEAVYGVNSPRIETSYLGDYIVAGETWRIYLKGSDPDGDIRFIRVWMEIPCRTTTPIRLQVDPYQKRSLSGYLTLNTLEFGGDTTDLFNGWIRLRVNLEDEAGHASNTAGSTVPFNLGGAQKGPPQGVFDERHLGRIPPEFLPVEPCTPGGNGVFPD